jgi:hypothetical protein
MNKALTAVVLAALLCAVGCTNYYKVHDPTSGKTYYTTELRHRNSGTATLTDARTGNKVTIQNSEIDKITKDEFETGKNTMPAEPMPAAK